MIPLRWRRESAVMHSLRIDSSQSSDFEPFKEKDFVTDKIQYSYGVNLLDKVIHGEDGLVNKRVSATFYQ